MIMCRHLRFKVIEEMDFDTSFLLAKFRPPEYRETQRDCGGIESINMAFQLEDFCSTLASCQIHHVEGELLKNPIIPVLVCGRKCRFSNGLATYPKMVSFRLMSFNCHYKITKAFSVAKLSEHQCKQLVPTSKVLDILVALVLSYEVIELASIQWCSQLREYVFVFIHNSQSISAAKIQNQIRFIAIRLIKDYYSIFSKIVFETFTGH